MTALQEQRDADRRMIVIPFVALTGLAVIAIAVIVAVWPQPPAARHAVARTVVPATSFPRIGVMLPVGAELGAVVVVQSESSGRYDVACYLEQTGAMGEGRAIAIYSGCRLIDEEGRAR